MFAILFVLSMLLTNLAVVQNSDGCQARNHSYCGPDCTGTPSCNGRTCGNVDNMCYCDCEGAPGEMSFTCRTTELGYKWNGGIKLKSGSYALNGTKGDGRQYKCH